MKKVPSIEINNKILLTLDEASLYSNLGRKKLTKLISEPGCPFLIKNGHINLIKREAFEEYLLKKKML